MHWNFFCKHSQKKDLTYRFFNTINDVNQTDWDQIVQNKNIYLSTHYLTAMEQSMHHEMQFRYILFYNHLDQPVAASAVQLVNFKDTGSKYSDLISKIGTRLKNKLMNSINVKVMICGNVFSCGENGFMYTEALTSEAAYSHLVKALFELRNTENSENKVSILLLKEFWPQSFDNMDSLKENQFSDFMIDVNMVLKIHESWKNLDDYLASMVTKFRTKAKGVFKKSKDIVVKDFSAEEIEKYNSQIENLYSHVVDHADFKFGKLTGDAFLQMKQNLGEKFVLKAYFLKDEIIGFSTAFVSNGIVDANYVGLNYEYNHEYALYQKMLYNYVEMAIDKNCSELRLGRTAEEIKSCLGAEPTNMKLFVRHKNTVSNRLLKPIIDSISPSEFELRKPFKASFSQL